ncbi:MAG: GspL/Epsl periplasmic domain-containing protein, partial [Litorimonas sp.]
PEQSVEHVTSSETLLDFLEVDTAINLRQNAFAPQNSFAVSGMKINIQTLGRLAALFFLCAVSWLGLEAATARAKGQEALFIQSETSRLYTETTGQAAPTNPALAATRAIQSGPKQNVKFLTLSKILFDGVGQTEGVVIETVQYDKSRSELSLRIIYPGFASATDLETAVSNFGGVFEAVGVREQGGQFIGDAVLRLGGGT